MKLIMANVVIVLLVLTFLYTCECFPCFRDECQSGVQYCVSERKRCYLCRDRLDECGTTSIPRDCIVLCENVLLNSRVSELNNTVAELKKEHAQLKNGNAELTKVITELTKVNTEVKKVNTEITKVNTEVKEANTELTKGNTELKEQLNRANATIQEFRISLKEERENLESKSSELNQHQEWLNTCNEEKWQIGVGIAAAAAAVIGIATLVGYFRMRPRTRTLDGQSKRADADPAKDDKDIAGDTSTTEASALLDTTDCYVMMKDDEGRETRNKYADKSESNQSKTTSSKSPISSIMSSISGNSTHSGSETGLTDSGYSNSNINSLKSNTDDEIPASNDNQGNQFKITSNGNANLSVMAKAKSLVVNTNNTNIFLSDTKVTDENVAETYPTNPPTPQTDPITNSPTLPTNSPTLPTNSQTNLLKGIPPTTDDSGDVNVVVSTR